MRDPTSKQIIRVVKANYGIHERWLGDGHDKLYSIGFPIWAVVDDATSKWLGAWVVPSNRLGDVVGYFCLLLIEKFGGMPVQFATDCGSETTQLYGLVNTLRATLFPEYDGEILPAHSYVRSVHNIAIEWSWLRLRLDWGNNTVIVFKDGVTEGKYNPDNTSGKMTSALGCPEMSWGAPGSSGHSGQEVALGCKLPMYEKS
ncbi:hypothetical protein BYT27DRAFT_7262852 [Phlegmacium glaucopus]|nr:hypothetical protein BYT27DRAFT_7262852 [Phlegmacium glaucopus]